MNKENALDAMLAPVKAMPPGEQLKFWRRFRTIHRQRIAKTEAALCPDVLGAVDKVIEDLRMQVATGV
jgi:hypothetical protein